MSLSPFDPTRAVRVPTLVLLLLAGAGRAQAGLELLSRPHPSLVSDSALGAMSVATAVSADGRFVAFSATSDEIVEGFQDATAWLAGAPTGHVYLRDRLTGEAVLVSHVPLSATRSGNAASESPAISADGRFVAFASVATDLVSGQVDTPETSDVFVFDRDTGVVSLVSHASDAPQRAVGCEWPCQPHISADGSVVVFATRAADVVAGQVDPLGLPDVFAYAVATGTNTLVSRAASGATTAGNSLSLLGSAPHQRALSGDGRRVVFASLATDLVAGAVDLNDGPDTFVFDHVSGQVTLISHAAGLPGTASNAAVGRGSLSLDGAWVAWESRATNVVAGQVDLGGHADVFLRALAGGPALLVSRKAGQATSAADGESFAATLSADGSRVSFLSRAGDLVAGAASNSLKAFLFEREAGVNLLVSRGMAGASLAVWGQSAVSDDGDRVAFMTSDAPGGQEQRGEMAVYLFDRRSDAPRLLSVSAVNPETWANGPSSSPQLSSDGRLTVFWSEATDLLTPLRDHNDAADLYAVDAVRTELVTPRAVEPPASTPAHGAYLGALSDDGRFVLVTSRSVSLVPGLLVLPYATNAYLLDRADGTFRLVSHRAEGAHVAASVSPSPALLSGDGRYVAFASTFTDVVAGQTDTNRSEDVFLYEVASGTLRLVSHASGNPLRAGNGGPSLPVAISRDGRFLVFHTLAKDLQAGVIDGNVASDLYVYDRVTDRSTLISHRHNNALRTANAYSAIATISADGGLITYESHASDIVSGSDLNDGRDVFLFDVATAANVLVSHRPGQRGVTGNGESYEADLSGDGRYVVFTSAATDIVSGQVDANADTDVFLYDRFGGALRLVSHVALAPAVAGDDWSARPRLSRDGSAVAFQSAAGDLVSGMTGGGNWGDVFLYDRAGDTNLLVSHAAGAPTVAADSASFWHEIDADGTHVGFASRATDLVPGQVDEPGTTDLFLYSRADDAASLATPRHGTSLEAVGEGASAPKLAADGTLLAFSHRSPELVPHDRNYAADVFAFTLPAETQRR